MIRVLVADHQPLIRNGLKYVLAQDPGFAPPGEAADFAEALQRVEEHDWDAVVLNLAIPEHGGLQTLVQIRQRRPHLPVLLLGDSTSNLNAVRAIGSGASGYLDEAEAVVEMPHAIRRIIAGKRYLSPRVAEALAEALQHGSAETPHERLSNRELLVMCRIAEGKTVSQIAEEIGRSVKTVSTHRARAMEKMNMNTNAEFIRYALRSGLVR